MPYREVKENAEIAFIHESVVIYYVYANDDIDGEKINNKFALSPNSCYDAHNTPHGFDVEAIPDHEYKDNISPIENIKNAIEQGALGPKTFGKDECGVYPQYVTDELIIAAQAASAHALEYKYNPQEVILNAMHAYDILASVLTCIKKEDYNYPWIQKAKWLLERALA